MTKQFFVGWALWEKLCFCLACAIVVTVFLGCLKLVYAHWKLRKYTAVAERERREQAVQRQMSQRRQLPQTQRRDEVPFGIRAIESGIEVDGVWISRSNTPETMSRQSSAGSLVLQHFQRRSTQVDLEKQLPTNHGRASSEPRTFPPRPASVRSERSISGLRLSSSPTSRDSSPDAAITKPPRSRHPPCSFSKYSTTPYVSRHSSSMSTLEGLEAIHRASTTINSDGSSGSSDSSGNENEPISASAPRLLTGQAIPRPRKPSVDLDLMNSHRISQAAETGQLTPRVRRTGQSRERSSTSLPTLTNNIAENADYFSRQKVLATPPPEEASPITSMCPPDISSLPAAIRRLSMPDVTPFAQFCQTAPPTPRPESTRPASRDSALQDRPTSKQESIYMSFPPSPLTSNPPTPPQAAQKGPRRPSFEKRESQVLRGHGSGFEILRPGSLVPPPPPAEHPMERQRAAAPPISLHNAYRPRSSSAESQRKLQKKRRPSMDSAASSEAGGKSRNSVL